MLSWVVWFFISLNFCLVFKFADINSRVCTFGQKSGGGGGRHAVVKTRT